MLLLLSLRNAVLGRAALPGAVLLAVLLTGVPLQVQGQAALGGEPGSELTVYHVFMGQGDLVYEKFEHNAIWIHDPVRGTDLVYNYGLFDFNEPGYWGRFLKGNWIYQLGAFDIHSTLRFYRQDNRSVYAQELNLTPAQRVEMQEFLQWNLSGENRFYLYDYYRDNCSTRVRDALDGVLGGRIRAATADRMTNTTYRWHSERMIADDKVSYTGLLVGLGPAADRPITVWEEMFLPGKLHEYLRTLQVPDEAGRMVPLVREERVLFQADRPAPRSAPPGWLGAYLMVGLALGALFAALSLWVPRARAARLAFGAVASLWMLVIGIGGVLLLGLWTLTNHGIAYRNENLLQFNPLALALVLLLPALAYGVRWAARPAYWLTIAVAGLSLLGLLLKVFPAFDQANGALIALTLPAHLGLAWAVYRLSGAAVQRTPVQPAPGPSAPRRRGAPAR